MDILENRRENLIEELYKKAGELHGHYCPGLAIGVRAAAAALDILSPEKKGKNLYCIAESRACYLDGIQVVFGTTVGNGRLEVRDSNEAAFNFYDRESGRSVRLAADTPAGLSRDEKRDFILTAPLDKVFTQTPVRFEAPPDLPPKKR